MRKAARSWRIVLIFLFAWIAGGLGLTAEALAQSGPACRVWRSEASLSGILGSDEAQIYVGTVSGVLLAIDSVSLSVKWRVELGGEFASDVLVLDSGVAVVTNTLSTNVSEHGSSHLRLLSREASVVLWSAKVARADKFYLGRSGSSLALISSSGVYSLFDGSNGQVRKEISGFGTPSSAVAFSAEKAAIGTSDKKVTVIKTADGEVSFRSSLDHTPTAISFAQGGSVAVGDERGNLFLLSGEDGGVIWRFKSGGAVSSIKGSDEGVFLASLDNFVYRLSNYNGDVVWKRRLPGRVTTTGLFLQDNLVVPVFGENSVYVIQSQKGKISALITPDDDDLLNRGAIPLGASMFALSGASTVRAIPVFGCKTN